MFARDMCHGFRTLLGRPGFALVVVISLACGIGVNTALFSLVNQLLLQSLPVRDSEQLVLVQRVLEIEGARPKLLGFSADDLEVVGSNTTVFSNVLGFSNLDRPAVRIQGVTEPPLSVQQVSDAFFRTLGMPMLMGASESNAPGAVISYRFWQTRFGGNANVLGSAVEINSDSYSIIGVAPTRFLGLELENSPDIWFESERPAVSYNMVGRLRTNVTAEHARPALEALFHHIDRHEAGEGRLQVRLSPAGRGLSSLRGQYEGPLLALMVLLSLVLLIMCINIGTLLTVRNSARSSELAVRVCLGARRSRLIMQLLVENAMLASVGSVLAVPVARGCVSGILSMLSSAPLALEFHVDRRTLAFLAAVSLFSTLLFALAPAWRATKLDVAARLRAGSGSTLGRDARKLARILIVGQVSLSVLLLAGAGLFVRTLRNLDRVDPGFDSGNLLQVLVDTESSGYPQEEVGEICRLLIGRLTAIPGVRSASATRNPIMRGPLSSWGDVEQVAVGPQFFDTMHVPLLQGRFFTPEEDDTAGFRRFPIPGGGVVDLPVVVVISESLAKQLFPGGDALGQPLPEPLTQHPLIIGVVKDARFSGLRDDPRPPIYVPQARNPDRFNAIEIRTVGNPSTVARAVQEEVRRINPRLLLGVNTMREEMDRSIMRERMVAAISTFFSTLALVLACVGLFGLASYSVAQRTNELGIRVAIGARRWDVIREALGETLLLFGVGLVVGVVMAIGGTRIAARAISELLFGLTATDSLNIAVAALIMIGTATLACLIPAHRAATVDPLAAIRYE
jgi:predicted permease